MICRQLATKFVLYMLFFSFLFATVGMDKVSDNTYVTLTHKSLANGRWMRIEMQAIGSNYVLFAKLDLIFLPYEFTSEWDVQLVVTRNYMDR